MMGRQLQRMLHSAKMTHFAAHRYHFFFRCSVSLTQHLLHNTVILLGLRRQAPASPIARQQTGAKRAGYLAATFVAQRWRKKSGAWLSSVTRHFEELAEEKWLLKSVKICGSSRDPPGLLYCSFDVYQNEAGILYFDSDQSGEKARIQAQPGFIECGELQEPILLGHGLTACGLRP